MTDQAKRVSDIFCEECDNILDITRSVPKGNDTLDTETPNTVSSDTEEEVEEISYEPILKKLEAGERPTDQELESVDLRRLVKDEYYRKMSGKSDIKKRLIDMIEELRNADNNTQAFLFCKNCAYSRVIKPNTRIMSKNPEGVASTHDYVNEANYRNKVHIRTIPCTRNFNCPNSECPGRKGKVPIEAVFFRKNANTYETVYVCKNCKTIKMN